MTSASRAVKVIVQRRISFVPDRTCTRMRHPATDLSSLARVEKYTRPLQVLREIIPSP